MKNDPSYNAAFYAKLFNLTERRIQQLAKDEIIPRAARGKYPLLGVIQGYVAYLQDRALGGELMPADMHVEKSALVRAQREKAEIEVLMLKGALIQREQVDAALGNLITACRARLLSIPTKAAAVAVSMTEAEVEGLLTDQIHEALHELSRSIEFAEPTTKADGEPVGRSKSRAQPRGFSGTRPVEH